MKKSLSVVILTGLLAACGPSTETVTVKPPVPTVATETPLDSETINNFLGALIRLNQIELEPGSHFAFEPRAFDDEGRFSPFSSNIGILNGLPEQAEARRVIDAAGLGTVEQFAAVGDRIYRAYAAISLEEESKAGSPQAKELMEVAQTVPKADRDAVRAYFEQLENILGDQPQ